MEGLNIHVVAIEIVSIALKKVSVEVIFAEMKKCRRNCRRKSIFVLFKPAVFRIMRRRCWVCAQLFLAYVKH